MTVPIRRLGATDLKIAPLALGGNVFGWTADHDASFAILDAFVDAGGSMIDTANVYSDWAPGHDGGESERMIGAWLKASGKRDRVQIATKVGWASQDLKPDSIARACHASLERLGIEHIDLYYAHEDDSDTPLEETLAAFQRLVDAGKVGVVGASHYRAARLKQAVDLAKADSSLARFHVLQPEYNLVNRHSFEGELQDYCIQENIGVMPSLGLASGFLTAKYRTAADLGKSPRHGVSNLAELVGTRLPLLAVMDAVAAESGAPLATIALAWLNAQPGVTAPIASASKPEQLPDLLAAMTLELSENQLARLTNAGT